MQISVQKLPFEFPFVAPFTLDNVMPSETILAVKTRIQVQEGYPVDQQGLFFESQELDNANTISSYNIQDGSLLFLIVGAPVPQP